MAGEAGRINELFHVTEVEHVSGIQERGLQPDEHGRIYLITKRCVANDVARDQLHLSRYAIFQVQPDGITRPLRNDVIGAPVAEYHRVARQQRIAPEFLSLLGEFDTEAENPAQRDELKGE